MHLNNSLLRNTLALGDDIDCKVDFIVSNPPYIISKDFYELPTQVYKLVFKLIMMMMMMMMMILMVIGGVDDDNDNDDGDDDDDDDVDGDRWC